MILNCQSLSWVAVIHESFQWKWRSMGPSHRAKPNTDWSAGVRFGAAGLKSDITALPKSANRRLAVAIEPGRVQAWWTSLSGRFLKAQAYYSIRAATDHRTSPEPFQARADELSRV